MRQKLLFPLFAATYLIAASSANAGVIHTVIPGSYTITGANWDGNGVAIVGNNNTTGAAFDLFNGILTSLTAVPGAMGNPQPFGQANGYVLANILDSSFLVEGCVFTAGVCTAPMTSLNFTSVGPGAEFGWQSELDGSANMGHVSSAGAVESLLPIQRIGGELSGLTLGVFGTKAAGVYSTGVSGHAVCAVGGVRQSLDTGSVSIADGVDGVTGNCYGTKDGVAGVWSSSGLFSTIPGVGGVGILSGEVESGYGGMYIVKDGNNGNLFVSDGTHTLTFSAYLTSLSIALPATAPPDAWFVGDPNSNSRALVFQGSIDLTTGTQADFIQPLQASATPEPATWLLLFPALVVMAAATRLRERQI